LSINLKQAVSGIAYLLILNVLIRHSSGKQFIIFTEKWCEKDVFKQMFETYPPFPQRGDISNN
jgi:hypothetical protein